MKKVLFLGLGLMAIGLILSVLRPPFFETLDQKLTDIHFVLRGNIPPTGEVVLVTIDEKSISKLGRWPWSRAVFARIFEELVSQGARVVSPDIFFAEPSGGTLGRQNDLALAQTLQKNPNIVIGYYFLLNPEELDESTLQPAQLEENFQNLIPSALEVPFKPRKVLEAVGVQNTLPIFSNIPGGRRLGFFNISNDSDGTVRQTAALIRLQDKIFPSIPLQITLSALKPEDPIAFLKKLRLERDGKILINFRGPVSVFPRVSVSEILEGKSEEIRGKVVLVGATAAGLEDNRPTPVDTTTQSVVLSANILDNLLEGDLLRRDKMTDLFSRLLIVLVGLILAFSLARLNALKGFILFLAVTLIQAVVLHLLFLKCGWVLQAIYPLFSGFVIYLGVTLFRYFGEEKEKKFISQTFQHYLSPDVIQELTSHPEKLALGGERKVLTSLFCDIRDFATIVETTPPEVLVSFLNSYLTPATDIILDHKGLLDKYIGDCIMAVFGAPLPEPEHPRLACESAVEMIRFLKENRARWTEEFKVPPLNIGIGINTGLMTVGNMGSQRRFDYTVMGDAVNLASRLEGLNKFYGTNILLSDATYEAVKKHFPFRELDLVQVKGKKQAVRIYELLVDPVFSKEQMLDLFSKALQRYRAGDFKEARILFEKCLVLDPKDGPSNLFLIRCREYEKKPPEDWEGVTEFRVK